MEWIVIVPIFFCVIAISGLMFGGWVVFSILRLIGRGISACFGPFPDVQVPDRVGRNGITNGPRIQSMTDGIGGLHGPYLRCGQEKCRQTNPTNAYFCRRCGHALPAPQRVAVSRAAMF